MQHNAATSLGLFGLIDTLIA